MDKFGSIEAFPSSFALCFFPLQIFSSWVFLFCYLFCMQYLHNCYQVKSEHLRSSTQFKMKKKKLSFSLYFLFISFKRAHRHTHSHTKWCRIKKNIIFHMRQYSPTQHCNALCVCICVLLCMCMYVFTIHFHLLSVVFLFFVKCRGDNSNKLMKSIQARQWRIVIHFCASWWYPKCQYLFCFFYDLFIEYSRKRKNMW